ncbi:hypothetical protein D915_010880 [Fasciola hepatica]|uniref:Uncharacterized protein n=1 Tax=Fasciola hepatica TaxID=6192 RepID=A0A4E0QY28_FASHE|nr:hypothetical protein D915_010880 [Fasciola hepatica]
MIKASESYRASQFFFQLRKHDLHPSFGATSPSVRLIRDEAENHCGERTPHTVLPPPAITIQHLQCRSVPRPNLRLHTSLDDTSSVLPAPPAPLLPGPRSPGLFDPITTPSIFATATSVSNETTARTAVLVDSAATYPLTRIYLYGSEPLVNAVLWTLRSACPLDRFQAKDGSSHRVWILTGSISELEKHSLSDSDQSGEPSMSATDTTALVSGPPDCKTLGISCVSAFSTPVISIPEDAQESSYGGHGTVKSMHSSEPNSRSTQSTDLGEVNGSCALPYTQLPVQFVVRVLVYNSLDQLNDFAQTLVADVDTARLNSGQVYALLLWSASQDHSSMASLIMNGLVLTSR